MIHRGASILPGQQKRVHLLDEATGTSHDIYGKSTEYGRVTNYFSPPDKSIRI